MTLTIDLAEEEIKALAGKAQAQGISAEEYARQVLAHDLEAPSRLGVTRTTLSELVNEKRGISPEMAVRPSKVFGGSAESWLVQQAQYDLEHVHAGRLS